MSPAKPTLVLLAAGASRRLGQCKALVRLRDIAPATPLELLLAGGANYDTHPPWCVTGADHEAIAAAAPPSLLLLHNPAWARGRTGGVRRAAERLAGHDLCLAPVDVPAVEREVFDLLLAAWRGAGSPARGWLAPRFEGDGRTRYGHPVIVGRELVAELSGEGFGDAADDRPLRELRRRADPRFAVETISASVLEDLDSEADLVRIRRRLIAAQDA